jgi:hypothetical protein
MATILCPFSSNRARIRPTSPRSTQSGLNITNVRSMNSIAPRVRFAGFAREIPGRPSVRGGPPAHNASRASLA